MEQEQIVKLFTKKNLGQIRILVENKNPLFCLDDICSILEHAKAKRIYQNIINELGRAFIHTNSLKTIRGVESFIFISKSQLQFTLMRYSNKPNAKILKQWIINEIIPQLNIENKNTDISQENHENHKKREIEKEDENLIKNIIKNKTESDKLSAKIKNIDAEINNQTGKQELQILKTESFIFNNLPVNVIFKDNGLWFIAKEICKILEHTNHKVAIQSLDEDEVKKVYLTDKLGRQQETNIISESGLYTLIIRSNKSSAKPFRKWITSEVLPAIRKTGIYSLKEDAAVRLINYNQVLRMVKLLKEYADLYRDKYDGRYSQILDSYAVKELTGENLLSLPEIVEDYYTADEVGEKLGVSTSVVGRLANLNNLKTYKYGKWFIKKDNFNKDIEIFKYNQAGIDIIKSLLQ